jgi:uncharacterized protein (DUF983 family)
MHQPDSPSPRIGEYLSRGLSCHCPECGQTKIFKPLRAVRSWSDWFDPVHACAHCGCVYDREPGYFLMATWGVNYGVVGMLALALTFIIDLYFPMTLWQYALFVLITLPILSTLFARHAKSLYLAMDHFLDPRPRK